jgi:predicted glycosyltransferase
MTDNDSAQVAAAANNWAEDLLRVELERACIALLAEGMPAAQVQQLIDAAAEMHAGQLAQFERDVAGALGQAPAIH